MGDEWGMSSTLDAGIRFLDQARSGAPLWSDFQTQAGASTEWVTAFALCALKRHRPEPDPPAVRELWWVQRPTGGWGYNMEVPPDCDSTAWVLLALGPQYLRPSALLRAESYVVRHQEGTSGGFATYTTEDQIHRYIAVDPSLVDGWTSPHGCVTAVAVQALMLSGGARRHDSTIRRAVEYLLHREHDGAWESYWWNGWAYATYHTLRALALTRALDPDIVSRAKRRLLMTQQQDGGWTDHDGGSSETFATAFSALALLLISPTEGWEAVRTAAVWLTARQECDGGWPAVPILRLPPPPETDPTRQITWRTDTLGTGVQLRDQSRVFTSAAAVRCLLTVEQCGVSSQRHLL